MTDYERLERVSLEPLRCLGPKEQDLDKLAVRLKKGRRPANRWPAPRSARRAAIETVAELKKSGIKNTDGVIAFAFRRGDRALATVVKSYANLGCNFDLRELIADLPRDGERRQLPCPKCGRVVTLHPPTDSTAETDTPGQ